MAAMKRAACALSSTLLLIAACGADPLPVHTSGGAGGEIPITPLPDGGVDAGAAPALGATSTAAGVTFRVWAPHATGARVTGDFTEQSVDMTAEPEGIFSAVVASARAGTRYQFTFDTPAGAIVRVDPRCRRLLDDGVSCEVVDPAAYAWKSAAFTRPAREASVVYEMHVGSFSVPAGAAYGTLADAQAGLEGLAELGVNVVELMPVQHFGGGPGGWGYNPQLYFSPRPSAGSADDLRAFVDEAHRLGIAVWLDTVINHYDGWSKAPLACYDGHCPTGSHGIYFFPPGDYATTDWGPRPDYTEPQVTSMLVDSARWWIEENRGDGFRWDSVSNIRALDGDGETPGGKELLVALNDLTHAAGALSVAEDLKGYAAITASPAASGFGFDAQWDGFGWQVADVLVPFADDGRDLGAVQGALTGSYNGDPFARLIFTETHDTVGNKGARLPERIDPADPTSFAARRRSMLAAALLFTTPGVPMLFMGQESLALGTFASPPAPLADALPAGGDLVRAFYKDLIALRRDRDGASGGLSSAGVEILHRNDANKVIAYRRHGAPGGDVIVVLNLRNKAYARYDVGVGEAGPYRVRVDADWKAYGADFGGGQLGSVDTLAVQKDGRPFTLPVKLGAYAAVIFTK